MIGGLTMIKQSNKCYLFGLAVDKEIYDAYVNHTYSICGKSVSFLEMSRYASDYGIEEWSEHQKEARAMLAKLKEEVAEFVESRRKMCPMSFASAEPSKCREDCAWFVNGEDESNCAVLEIAYSLRLIENDTENAAESLCEICKNMENANATP
jgi:hypothetical protein